jgi:hypothetical protein
VEGEGGVSGIHPDTDMYVQNLVALRRYLAITADADIGHGHMWQICPTPFNPACIAACPVDDSMGTRGPQRQRRSFFFFRRSAANRGLAGVRMGDSHLARSELGKTRCGGPGPASLEGIWSNELTAVIGKRPDFQGREKGGDNVILYGGKGDTKKYGPIAVPTCRSVV